MVMRVMRGFMIGLPRGSLVVDRESEPRVTRRL
jgi:hypothetical protein